MIFIILLETNDFMIRLQVIGNLGKDCTVNTVNGKGVINFSVAHTEKWRDANGDQKEKTTWVECAYWTDKQGIVPYLKKGTTVYVEGTPDARGYLTSDNKPGAALQIRVSSVQLIGGRATSDGTNSNSGGYQSNAGNQYASTPNISAADISEPLDDLPF